jgi:hypothetical protein
MKHLLVAALFAVSVAPRLVAQDAPTLAETAAWLAHDATPFVERSWPSNNPTYGSIRTCRFLHDPGAYHRACG